MIYYLRKQYKTNTEQREAVIVFYKSMSAKKQQKTSPQTAQHPSTTRKMLDFAQKPTFGRLHF